jgi:hypothetical protein
MAIFLEDRSVRFGWTDRRAQNSDRRANPRRLETEVGGEIGAISLQKGKARAARHGGSEAERVCHFVPLLARPAASDSPSGLLGEQAVAHVLRAGQEFS